MNVGTVIAMTIGVSAVLFFSIHILAIYWVLHTLWFGTASTDSGGAL